MATKDSYLLRCPVCPNTPFSGVDPWRAHLASKSHRRKQARSEMPNPKEGVFPEQDLIYNESACIGVCYVCNNYAGFELTSKAEKDIHVRRESHLVAMDRWNEKTLTQAIAEDIRGLQINQPEAPMAGRTPIKPATDDVTELSKYVIFNPDKNDVINRYMCCVCEKALNGKAPVQEHLRSAKHKKQESASQSVAPASGSFCSLKPEGR